MFLKSKKIAVIMAIASSAMILNNCNVGNLDGDPPVLELYESRYVLGVHTFKIVEKKGKYVIFSDTMTYEMMSKWEDHLNTLAPQDVYPHLNDIHTAKVTKLEPGMTGEQQGVQDSIRVNISVEERSD